ncbi:hypothetical protein O5826_25150, partial [Escherichia coli]|nr:hypothetical protein [Escherichia coli]MCZ5990036.1 hypothetical protein [Escherichia coli]
VALLCWWLAGYLGLLIAGLSPGALLVGYSLPTLALGSLALGYAVTDSGDVRSPSDRSVAVGVHY